MKRARLLLLGIIFSGFVSLGYTDSPDNLENYKNFQFSDHITTDTVQKEKNTVNHVAVTSQQTDVSNNLSSFKDLYELTGSNGARLNVRAVSFVQGYMEKNSDDLEKMRIWGKPYFNMMDQVLVKYGLPKELKYLAVIESELKPTAVSCVGAVGPWQLMPETARILGLKVNKKIDERKNYYKSTNAAAQYLRDLYAEFGDWLLVIAAYNGGTANVYSAIRKSGSRDFWNLQYFLPAESRNHVKKFISTHYIFEGQGGLTTLTKKEAAEQLGASAGLIRQLSGEELKNIVSLNVKGKYFSAAVAKNILMDLNDFNRYNPDFDKLMANSNTYELKLPAQKMPLFVANKYQILNESVQLLLNGTTAAVVTNK